MTPFRFGLSGDEKFLSNQQNGQGGEDFHKG